MTTYCCVGAATTKGAHSPNCTGLSSHSTFPEPPDFPTLALVALLKCEWDFRENYHNAGHIDENDEPCCPCCGAEPGNPHPGDRKHNPKCWLDRALKAAGLPDQESRRAREVELAKEGLW